MRRFFHTRGSSRVGREAHGGGAGFYFHLEPGKSMVGGGCWMPPRPALNKFRAAITNDLRAFERLACAPALERGFGGLGEEEMLKGMPRGYSADQPAARWLRFQSFTVGRRLSDREVTSSKLTATLAKDYERMLPLVRWLNGTLGLEPLKRR